jgi:hypothetical protein
VHHPGRDVGGAEREELAPRVDPVVVPGREGAGGEHVVGEADHGDGERGGQQRPRPQRRHGRQADRRQRERQVAHDRHPVLGQPGQGHGEGRREHAEQRDRAGRPQPRADQQRDERAQAHREGGPVDDGQVLHQPPRLRQGFAGRDVGRRRAPGLGQDHQAGDARHVADEHRLGEQVGEEAEPAGPGEQAHRADRHRQQRGGVLRGLAGQGDGRQCRARHQRRRRLGAHRELG